MAKTLVIGSGGREHALGWNLHQHGHDVYFVPGNPGTAQIGTNLPIKLDNGFEGIAAFVKIHNFDLTVVGPEAPLCAGIVDVFQKHRLPIFGPTQAAALLEGSKNLAKQVMRAVGVRTANCTVCHNNLEALAFLQRDGVKYPLVVKADGLCAGKGVYICANLEEAQRAVHELMVERVHGASGDRVILEDFIHGREVSVIALTDGTTVYPLLPARDHKRLLDGDLGPNTGGMGAYAPVIEYGSGFLQRVTREVFQPIVDEMRARHTPFRGALYAGLMVTPEGKIYVLEFNCRFGDPETQALMLLLKSDLYPYLLACTTGTLHQLPPPTWHPGAAVCVTLAAKGYPDKPEKGDPIVGLERLVREPGMTVFHCGTALDTHPNANNTHFTAGGRVLSACAVAPTLAEARTLVYRGIRESKVGWNGMQYRTGIAEGVA